MFSACSDLGQCPEEESNSLAAFEALRGCGLYQEEEAKVAPFDMSLVSLPEAGNEPVPLEELWGPGGHEQVSEFIFSKLLPRGDADAKLLSAPRVPYHDPVLRRGSKQYLRLIRRLHAAGMIEFSRSCAEKVGLFFVRKKSGKLRLVIDARRSNCWFRESDSVDLATGTSLGEIHVEPGDTMYIGHVDICDAFYHFGLPVELRQYFGLDEVRAADVGITQIDGIAVRPDELVFPLLTVLPMGWTHALKWCQSLHERIMDGVGGLGAEQYLHDRSDVHSVKNTMYTIYVDNFLVFGTDPAIVKRVVIEADARLRAARLPTHEVEHCATDALVLGWEFDGVQGILRPSPRRAWRIIRAIDLLAARRFVRVRDLQRVLGHCTFVGMLRRECLAIFGKCTTWYRARGLPIRFVSTMLPKKSYIISAT